MFNIRSITFNQLIAPSNPGACSSTGNDSHTTEALVEERKNDRSVHGFRVPACGHSRATDAEGHANFNRRVRKPEPESLRHARE